MIASWLSLELCLIDSVRKFFLIEFSIPVCLYQTIGDEENKINGTSKDGASESDYFRFFRLVRWWDKTVNLPTKFKPSAEQFSFPFSSWAFQINALVSIAAAKFSAISARYL